VVGLFFTDCYAAVQMACNIVFEIIWRTSEFLLPDDLQDIRAMAAFFQIDVVTRPLR
jgi:hypothetical protein